MRPRHETSNLTRIPLPRPADREGVHRRPVAKAPAALDGAARRLRCGVSTMRVLPIWLASAGTARYQIADR
jgi:hypothetical protein